MTDQEILDVFARVLRDLLLDDSITLMPETRREDIGHEHRDQAVEIGHRNAEANQGEHVETAVCHRLNRTDVKRPGSPHADGGSQQEIKDRPDPCGEKTGERCAREHVAHRDEDKRGCERSREPETAGHVA